MHSEKVSKIDGVFGEEESETAACHFRKVSDILVAANDELQTNKDREVLDRVSIIVETAKRKADSIRQIRIGSGLPPRNDNVSAGYQSSSSFRNGTNLGGFTGMLAEVNPKK